MMRTAQLTKPNQFTVIQADAPPDPGPGQVRIRVRGCGVCASNLGPWSGLDGIGYPMDAGAPGHEVYGTIDAVGPETDGLAPGQAVTALSYQGFADHDLAEASAVVPLPGELADRPVLGEPVACAVNAARRADVREGDVVVVLGVGFLGALLIKLARRADPARIIAVSRRRQALEVGEHMGADDRLTYDEDVATHVAQITDGRMADIVIEATGAPGPLALGAELARVRGRLVIAGYHQDAPRSVNMQLWNWRGLDVINAHEREPALYRQGMEEGVRLLGTGELDLDPLLTHFVPLGEINRAFQLAEARPNGFFKAVVTPEDAV